MVALAGACGHGIFSEASSSATATTAPTVGTGEFLYVTNNGDGTVSEYTRAQSNGVLTRVGTATAGATGGPLGITAAPSGNFVYVANSADSLHQFSINLSTGKLAHLGANNGTVPAGTAPQWVAVVPSGSFAYATNLNSPSISQYAIASNGALTAKGANTSLLLTHPYGAIATNSFLYVSDNGNGSLLSFAINANGTLGSVASTPSSSSTVRSPGQVIIDSGNQFVYVSDLQTGNVSFFTTSGGPLTLTQTILPTVPGSPANGLALAAPSSGSEFLYVAQQTAGSITLYTVNTLTGVLTGPTLAWSSISSPTGLAVDPSGSFLYVTSNSSAAITEFTISAINGSLTNPLTVATGKNPEFIAIAH
jgi:6-phosphogluconolactonase